MEPYKKNRLLFWLLIALIVLNIATLSSFFIFSGKSINRDCKESPAMTCSGFCKELDLTAAQTQKVEIINMDYRSNASVIVSGIKDKRSEILNELNKEQPDTLITNELVTGITLLQSMLQRENIKQYLELKTVCTPEQAQRLSVLYRDLYGCPMQKEGMQNRYRKRQGGCTPIR